MRHPGGCHDSADVRRTHTRAPEFGDCSTEYSLVSLLPTYLARGGHGQWRHCFFLVDGLTLVNQ